MRPHKGITAQPHSPMLEQAAPHAMRPAVSSGLLPSLARRSHSERRSRPSCQGGLHGLHARAAYKDHCNRANGLCAAHLAQARCCTSQKTYRAPPRPAQGRRGRGAWGAAGRSLVDMHGQAQWPPCSKRRRASPASPPAARRPSRAVRASRAAVTAAHSSLRTTAAKWPPCTRPTAGVSGDGCGSDVPSADAPPNALAGGP